MELPVSMMSVQVSFFKKNGLMERSWMCGAKLCIYFVHQIKIAAKLDASCQMIAIFYKACRKLCCEYSIETKI